MTASEWKALKQDASDTLQAIDIDKLTKASYTLLGASLAILDHDEGKDTPAAVATSTTPYGASDSQTVHDIKDELRDAEKYLKRYPETKDADYLQMAFDESSHALKFIRELPDGEQKHGYMARHDQIVDQIRRYGMAI